jgi:cellulose synthase/poly-beta-1,6-N-acetylglucosamine synthase-like glycosyltransferase
MEYLPQTLPALATAVGSAESAELVVVDNGSTDGTWEWLQAHAPNHARLLQHGGRVGEIRNHGVRHSAGSVICFVDADCLVEREHVNNVLRALDAVPCAATGSRYALPERPHWIERSWDALHATGTDGDRQYLNGGNLSVRRSAFEAVGGFDPFLVSGEDAEFCYRLRAHGYRVYECRAVRVVHLGNAKTLPSFFRKQVWHGEGALGTAHVAVIDKPLLMTVAYPLSVVLGLLLALRIGGVGGVGVLVLACFAVPVAAVTYRCLIGRRLTGAVVGVGLYTLYFVARGVALVKHLTRTLLFPRDRSRSGPVARTRE